MSDCVAILSGGMDSTTMVYKLVDEGLTPLCLSFDYGQRHSKELTFAAETCDRLGLEYSCVDLSSITGLLASSNSVLVDKSVPVPEGHYAHDNMAQTVVPNRNMIMLSIASGAAVANGHEFVATGIHAGDHYQYPDCRPEFISVLTNAIVQGNEGFIDEAFCIYAPFLTHTKADIAYEAIALSMPFEKTWSCYKGGRKHCGKCGTCVERLEAINEAEHKWIAQNQGAFRHDLTEYEDAEYWRTAVAEYDGAS